MASYNVTHYSFKLFIFVLICENFLDRVSISMKKVNILPLFFFAVGFHTHCSNRWDFVTGFLPVSVYRLLIVNCP